MTLSPAPATTDSSVDLDRLTGAQALIRSLEELGVTTLFGLPGGAILPAYDPLHDSTVLRHILVRHEQGAGHAAEGYAQSSGRTGVCLVTSGPGATNLVTSIANAHMDSTPVVYITGQVSSAFIGTDAFQEADITGMTLPITKHNYLVTDPSRIAPTLQEAFHLASTGRPGPVLVDITKDALQATTTFSMPGSVDLPGYAYTPHPRPGSLQRAADLLRSAQRPALYAGGGLISAEASEILRKFVEQTGIPVVTTLMGLGVLPDTHENHLGMPGMHGSVAAVTALQKADVILALGVRFDDRVTGRLDSFAPHAKIIHGDIDPAEISKNRHADVPIVGDGRLILERLCALVGGLSIEPWWGQLQKWKERYPVGYDPAPEGLLAPQHVIERIGALSGPEAYIASGVGQHQMWASQFVNYQFPRRWLNSGGLGTMGYAVPAAMGAKVAHPDSTVWAIDGDGCFQMTNQELVTCRLNNVPIKVAVINNSSLGMVRQWQTLFYDGRYSHTDLQGTRHEPQHEVRIPDFVQLAQAYDCLGLRCESPDQIDEVIKQALAVNDRPVVIDFIVHRDAMVWPMVTSGVSNDAILIARDQAPDWDRDL